MDYIYTITLTRCPRELGQAELCQVALAIGATCEQLGIPETIPLIQPAAEAQTKAEVDNGPQK